MTPDPKFLRRRVVTGVAAVLAAMAILGLFGVPIWVAPAAATAVLFCLSFLWVIKRFDLTSLGSDRRPPPQRDESES